MNQICGEIHLSGSFFMPRSWHKFSAYLFYNNDIELETYHEVRAVFHDAESIWSAYQGDTTK